MHMKTSTHRLSLLGVAVAASLQLAACGGGGAGAPDVFPPTVTITSGAVNTASGPVTFTFTFSEAVGTSFSADDLIVSGGAAGSLTKVSDTQYTLVVTPPSGARGDISVAVKALAFSDAAGNMNKSGPTVTQPFNTATGPVCSTTEPTCAPTTAIPSGALRIFSDAASIAGLDMAPDWGQEGLVTRQGASIAGDNAQKYVFLGPDRLYQGITWETSPQDVSSRGKLHLDMWSVGITSVRVSLIGGGRETAVTKTLTAGEWNSIDIDLSEFTQTNLTQAIQIKLEPTTAGTLYVDNIYFHGTGSSSPSCGTTEPTCAPTTVVPSGALRIFSDAASVSGLDMAPDWGQEGTVTRAAVTIAGNNVQRYQFADANRRYQGITWETNPQNVSTFGKVHLNVWSADVTSVKVSLIGGGRENGITKPLTARQWNTIEIDLSEFTSPDLSQASQFKLEPGTVGSLYVDNIYFHGSASGGGGGGAGGSPLTFASNYTESPPWRTTQGGDAGRYAADGALDWWSGLAAGDATPNFYFGYGLLPTDWGFGAFVNAPGNGTAAVSSYSNIRISVWGNDELVNQNPRPNFDLIMQATAVAGGCIPEVQRQFQVTGAGAQTYTLALSSMVVRQDCGQPNLNTASAILATGVKSVHVQVTTANLNKTTAVNAPTGRYSNGLNIGPISFN
jgi:hypothetical protein